MLLMPSGRGPPAVPGRAHQHSLLPLLSQTAVEIRFKQTLWPVTHAVA